MVALYYHGFTHDASAHTSYLFIVKDRLINDGISLINPAQNPYSVSFRLSPHWKTLFQESHPCAGAGRPVYMLPRISVNIFPSILSVSGSI
jgi:hypothetical protein